MECFQACTSIFRCTTYGEQARVLLTLVSLCGHFICSTKLTELPAETERPSAATQSSSARSSTLLRDTTLDGALVDIQSGSNTCGPKLGSSAGEIGRITDA